MGAGWHSFTRADTSVAEHFPTYASPQAPPPDRKLLCSVLCCKKVCGCPEKFQQRFVTPVGPMIPHPSVWRSPRAGCTKRPDHTAFRLGGEAAVTSSGSQEKKKVWVCFKELQWYCRLGVTPDGVVTSTYAQNRNGHFIHVSQRLIVFPVRIPATPRFCKCCRCRAPQAEQRFLQAT